eukprot:gnl/TRDRNA2_/TRDRNA2_208253_c0_seq1.p1 gnl/TRDRNA2_/TRDRNA2_208253_c0~~gnl/TRDRNA2_/TRDRNA2_208253_c0_seq1.p1  ORF type:complete len:280 (+),score=45.93 gnl/TRDRNA2_/TRDRNA2_208253_c0_seq1:133-972(+)
MSANDPAKQPARPKDGGYPASMPRECEVPAATGDARPSASASASSNSTPTSGIPVPVRREASDRIPGSAEVSTIAVSYDSSSERSEVDLRSGTEAVQWNEMKLGHRIQPYRGYAHCLDDIFLVSRFLELAQLSDIDGDSVKLLLRAVKLLRLCDYSVEDICSIMAHTSWYFIDTYALCGRHMDASEVGNVIVTLMFISHAYVQDETCPLHVWHQHLFRRYCPLRTLNAAIVRLLEIRRYVLRVDEKELMDRYTFLIRGIQKRRVDTNVGDDEWAKGGKT